MSIGSFFINSIVVKLKHRPRTTEKIQIFNHITFSISNTPVCDIALFTSYSNSAFSHLVPICRIRYSISLIINLCQGILYCIINFQFEYEDVCLGLDNHISTTEYALDFGINFTVKEREYCIEDSMISLCESRYNESTLESGIFEIPFDYHVHLGWFAAKDSSRENICKNHL